MLGLLFSPFRALSRGCLSGIGCCLGVILVLVVIGLLLGILPNYFTRSFQ